MPVCRWLLSAGRGIGSAGAPLIAESARLLYAGLAMIGSELRVATRIDLPFAVIAVVFLLALVPIIPHATRDAQLLTCCFDDEAPLTMALDGMRFWPYGDPFNLLQSTLYGSPQIPAYWGKLVYGGFWYYGGTYLDLAFLFYWPAYLVGLPPFPTAPIILRTISAAMALLALSVTYNFGSRHSGAVAGAVAALFLLSDPSFVGYAAHIHPDTTELALGLLALSVALRHLERGDEGSLVALGLLAGLVQGTKCGAAWLVPMAVLSVVVGYRRLMPGMALQPLISGLLRRGLLIGGFALVAFIVSTPYAFLKPDFFLILRAIWNNIHTSSMVPVSYSTWLAALWGYHGPLVVVPALAGVAGIAMQALRGNLRWPMILAVTLAATQLFWFSYNGRSWVVLGYMLTTFAVIGLLLGDIAETVFLRLKRFASPAGFAFAGGLFAVLVAERWYGLAGLPLDYLLTEERTVVAIGNWAEAGNLPRHARILWDDSIYIDPEKFPFAKMNGHLISYNDLYRFRPDYLIISSHMYDAPHYAAMRETQHYAMQEEGPNSLRLYQDLLSTDRYGPTQVPGIEYLRRFSQSLDRTEDCPLRRDSKATYSPWLGPDGPGKAAEMVSLFVGGGWFGGWLGGQVSTQLSLLNYAGRMIDALRGHVCISIGPTLRLYRVNPPGSPNGFSEPFASSARPGNPALAAFDGEPSVWTPKDGEILSSFIGFDFGAGGDKAVGSVRIDWGKPAEAASKIEVEYADFGSNWRPAEAFEVNTHNAGDLTVSEHRLPDHLGSHRRWRVSIRGVPPGGAITIREVRFMAREAK